VNENKASKQAEMTSGKCCNNNKDKQREQKQADEEGRKRDTHTQRLKDLPSFYFFVPQIPQKNKPPKKKTAKETTSSNNDNTETGTEKTCIKKRT
jgi:hypothetical protein